MLRVREPIQSNARARRKLVSSDGEGLGDQLFVLRDSGVPSVLVEAAFISHADDEARLRDPAFRQRIAGAIHKGIMRFLAIYPAPVAP